MTEPVKFPVTGNHSPSAVYIRDISTPTSNPRLSHSLLPSQYSIKYLRADTATPNDEVYQMMLECAEMGVNREDKPTRIVDEVFNRYAPDSNNVQKR
ncbi:hypothetical protein [Carnimonas bestiolae]|uniref:hypothetical protein n=1 Tax=Carnimonas bestiolae TaxID=3402172 RepID=UPI003EDBB292